MTLEIPEPDEFGRIIGRWRPVLDGVRIRGVIDTGARTAGYELDVYGTVSVIDNGAVTAAYGALSACSAATITMGRRALGVMPGEAVAGPVVAEAIPPVEDGAQAPSSGVSQNNVAPADSDATREG